MVKLTEHLCKELGGEWYKEHNIYGPNTCVGINLSGANIPKADLSSARLSDANLYNAILWNANLSYASLDEVYFSHADLNHANFFEADLTEASFFGANLSNADFGAVELNRESVKSLLKIKPDYLGEQKEQVEKNRELIKQELLLSGV